MIKIKSLSEYIDQEEKVGVFSGRMQPVTKAHLLIIEKMSNENKRGVVFLVKGKKSSEDRELNPFDLDTQIKLIEAILPKNVTLEVISTGFFPDELNKMSEKDFTIYAGSDRVATYAKWSSYMEDGRTLVAEEVQRTEEDISASKVRTALTENNKEAFEELTPKAIHSFYDELHNLVMI